MPRKRVDEALHRVRRSLRISADKPLPEALGEVPADVAIAELGRAAGRSGRLGAGAGWCLCTSSAEASPLWFRSGSAIEHLRQQVTTLTDLQFHRELTSLINRLRDAHTQYSGPRTIAGAVATLPFLVEAWGPADDCHYVVSKVSDRKLVQRVPFRTWRDT